MGFCRFVGTCLVLQVESWGLLEVLQIGSKMTFDSIKNLRLSVTRSCRQRKHLVPESLWYFEFYHANACWSPTLGH